MTPLQAAPGPAVIGPENDVHKPHEFAGQTLPDALNVPLAQFRGSRKR